MASSLFECRRDNPNRPADWRWALARELVSPGKRSPGKWSGDEQVEEIVQLLGELKRDQSNGPVIARCHPHLWDARAIRLGEPLFRAEVEARILAGEADEVIAEKCGLSPEVVAAYHDTFFDVRDRLDRQSFILLDVLGPDIYGAFGEDPVLALKVFAYRGGPLILEALLRRYRRDVSSVLVEALTQEQLEEQRLQQWLQLLLAAASLRPGRGFAKEAARLQSLAEQLEKQPSVVPVQAGLNLRRDGSSAINHLVEQLLQTLETARAAISDLGYTFSQDTLSYPAEAESGNGSTPQEVAQDAWDGNVAEMNATTTDPGK